MSNLVATANRGSCTGDGPDTTTPSMSAVNEVISRSLEAATAGLAGVGAFAAHLDSRFAALLDPGRSGFDPLTKDVVLLGGLVMRVLQSEVASVSKVFDTLLDGLKATGGATGSVRRWAFVSFLVAPTRVGCLCGPS